MSGTEVFGFNLVVGKSDYLNNYLEKHDIPLYLKNGTSVVILILEGYRKAGISAQAFSKFTKKYFSEKPKNTRIINYILDCEHKKHCYSCDTIKNKDDFYINRSKFSGINSNCINCFLNYQKEYYPENKYKYNRSNKIRKAKINKYLPKWADLEKIKEIYAKCPTGYHVDHIIPIQGDTVCGLHVENNLQYLTAKENLRKGNKFQDT